MKDVCRVNMITPHSKENCLLFIPPPPPPPALAA